MRHRRDTYDTRFFQPTLKVCFLGDAENSSGKYIHIGDCLRSPLRSAFAAIMYENASNISRIPIWLLEFNTSRIYLYTYRHVDNFIRHETRQA